MGMSDVSVIVSTYNQPRHLLRCRLNRASRTRLYWLGSNASCWCEDLETVKGFDNRFSCRFEDGDFGNRLEMYGITPSTVCWTAVLLHLGHLRPWPTPWPMRPTRN